MRFIQKFSQNNWKWMSVFSVFIFIAALLLGVSIGTVSIPLSSLLQIIYYQFFSKAAMPDEYMMYANIIFNVRLPRVILAMIVGASLALAGAAFQGLLKNPLADPYTLGISSGASVAAVLVLFFQIEVLMLGKFTLPVAGIIGGFLTLLLVIGFSQLIDRNFSVETVILTGIIVSSFLGSLLSLMIALTGEELRQIINWLLGSVAMRGYDYIWLAIPFLIIGTLLIFFNSDELNVLSFGEETAKQLGVDVKKRKYMLLIGASLLTGSSVAVSGTIGFVGLVIPHMTRMLVGPNHRRLLPLSFLNGASFLVLADLVSRTIIAPQELPIGVITALIGAPVFAIIFYQQRKRK